jgi:hypothetical protein
MGLVVPEIPEAYRNRLFVYADCRPCGTPFYVGIGDAARIRLARRHRNEHHGAIVRKHPGCYRKILCVVGTREQANDLESRLIARYGRTCDQSGVLVNRSAGGDGYTNPSPEAREARRKAMTGKTWKNAPGANRAGVEAARKVLIGNTHTLGLRHTEEAKVKMSQAAKGRPKSEAMKANLAAARKVRHARVLKYLEQTGQALSTKRVTNAMMDAWFSREGQKCE